MPDAPLAGSLLPLPLHRLLDTAHTILLAGAGGGFDIFCGLPLYFGLTAAGKQVHLANFSFSQLHGLGAPELAPRLVEVSPVLGGGSYWGGNRYFPELYLSQWFATRGEHVPIYCFERTGVQPLARAYTTLIDRLGIEAVILIDGGTDGLMRGDEAGLGTPAEDVASIVAVDSLNLATAVLICVGFGVDTYHGVAHAHVLEAVADLIRTDGFLGAWSLMRDMPEVQRYREATEAVYHQMPQHPSIVSMSILSAINANSGTTTPPAAPRGACSLSMP